MKQFWLVRSEDVSGTRGTGRVAEGIVFSNGWCAPHWLTKGSVRMTPESRIEELEREVKRLRESLESIASKHRPRHSEEAYWMGLPKAQLAEVLATDTKIARQALSGVSREGGLL